MVEQMNASTAVVDHGSSSHFDFMSLPSELRDRIYKFAAMSCSDTGPLRLRSTLEIKKHCKTTSLCDQTLPFQVTTSVIYRHTLHNMMLVNHDIHAGAKLIIYCYVPIYLPLGYAPIRHALDITLSKIPKDEKLLVELAQCRVLIPAKDPRLDDRTFANNAQYMTKLLDWWNRDQSPRLPSAQLHIQVLDYIQGSKMDLVANSILEWLAKHEPNHDSLKQSIRFLLDDVDEADLRLCSISVGPGLGRFSYTNANDRRRQVAQVRRLFRRYPNLVISKTVWTTMEGKSVDQDGLEIVTFRRYIARVRPKVLATQVGDN